MKSFHSIILPLFFLNKRFSYVSLNGRMKKYTQPCGACNRVIAWNVVSGTHTHIYHHIPAQSKSTNHHGGRIRFMSCWAIMRARE